MKNAENEKKANFMTERLTKKVRIGAAPYVLKSKNDAIVSPHKTYDLFYEITFRVIQKLGVYEISERRRSVWKQCRCSERVRYSILIT